MAKKTQAKKTPKRKKTATKKKSTKKTVAKKRPVTRSVRAKIKSKPSNPEPEAITITESMSFGLLQEEIDTLIEKHLGESEDANLSNTIREELVALLPKDEAVVTSKDPKNQNIVIQNIRDRHKHSPYVLDLKKLIKEKEDRIHKKEFVRQALASQKKELDEKHRIFKRKAAKPRKVVTVVKKQAKPVTPKKQISIPDQELDNQFTREGNWARPQAWYKPVMTFAAICLLVIVPIKGLNHVRAVMDSKTQIIEASQQAYEDLKIAANALSSSDEQAAQAHFAAAEFSFSQANQELDNLNQAFTSIVSLLPKGDAYLTEAKRLTMTGGQLADLGQRVTEAFTRFYNAPADSPLTDNILLLSEEVETILPSIIEINHNLSQVDASLIPSEQQGTFRDAQEKFATFTLGLVELADYTTQLADLLGHHYERRYLVVFQNNTELRATGGFMGSLALIDIHNGEITNIEIPGGGTYDFQGYQQLQNESPYPLHLINPRWELQDTNWFFDFPTSAQNIQKYYEHGGGPSVDGVIALNASVIEDLLKHTEPIELPEYNKTITSDNFMLETQKSVELEYDKKENKPKQFLADMAPLLLEQLFDREKTNLLGMVSSLKQGLAEKNIQMYFNSKDFQQTATNFNWTGEIKETSKDYLAVVNSNIAGGKTDGVIIQHIDHESSIQNDGTIIDTVTITREHTGGEADVFSGVRNVNFVRIYVPQGSELISADGFDAPPLELFESPADYIKQDATLMSTQSNKRVAPDSGTLIHEGFGKTVFGNWTQTDPQEKSVVTLVYKLPYKIEQPERTKWQKLINQGQDSLFYSVFYQKQSGANNSTLSATIKLPDTLQSNWSYPAEASTKNNTISHLETFNTDTLIGTVIDLH